MERPPKFPNFWERLECESDQNWEARGGASIPLFSHASLLGCHLINNLVKQLPSSGRKLINTAAIGKEPAPLVLGSGTIG
ncbi:MAG: hypothetical protein F6K09_12890 [Merismopedia sp. SIO2A8]|nr:hypothetical protein [Merismopedia sp. SIO2A8]